MRTTIQYGDHSYGNSGNAGTYTLEVLKGFRWPRLRKEKMDQINLRIDYGDGILSNPEKLMGPKVYSCNIEMPIDVAVLIAHEIIRIASSDDTVEAKKIRVAEPSPLSK